MKARFTYILRNQRGSSEVVSFIGLIPFVLLIIISILQLATFSYVLVVTESAVRDGGRAAAAKRSAQQAVHNIELSSGIALTATEVCPSGEGYVSVTVIATVPTPFFRSAVHSGLTIARTVIMPREGNCL